MHPHQQTSHDTIALEVIAEESSNDETAMSPYSFSPAIGWIAALSAAHATMVLQLSR